MGAATRVVVTAAVSTAVTMAVGTAVPPRGRDDQRRTVLLIHVTVQRASGPRLSSAR